MPRPRAPTATATRERILAAAIRRFARHSYEETTLRAIAADAGVDVAWVHRSFGSKETLLVHAVEATVAPGRLAAVPAEGVVDRLVEDLFRPEDESEDAVGPLDIVYRSVNSREAQPLLRGVLTTDFVAPLSAVLPPPAETRAVLLAATLLGIGVLRDVLRVEALRDRDDADLRELVRDLLERLVGRPPIPPPPTADPAPSDEV